MPTSTASGYELRARELITLLPFKGKIVGTGHYILIPFGHRGRIEAHNVEHGVFATGIVPDAKDIEVPVEVYLFNSSDRTITIAEGTPFAVIHIEKIVNLPVIECDTSDPAFGHIFPTR